MKSFAFIDKSSDCMNEHTLITWVLIAYYSVNKIGKCDKDFIVLIILVYFYLNFLYTILS